MCLTQTRAALPSYIHLNRFIEGMGIRTWISKNFGAWCDWLWGLKALRRAAQFIFWIYRLAISANSSTGANEQHIKQHLVLQIRNGYLSQWWETETLFSSGFLLLVRWRLWVHGHEIRRCDSKTVETNQRSLVASLDFRPGLDLSVIKWSLYCSDLLGLAKLSCWVRRPFSFNPEVSVGNSTQRLCGTVSICPQDSRKAEGT